MVWLWLYNGELGLINLALRPVFKVFGLEAPSWLSEKAWAAARRSTLPKFYLDLTPYLGARTRYWEDNFGPSLKWLRGGAPADDTLMGSGDIQSLADLGNSFEVVKGMKPVPFGKDTVLQLVAAHEATKGNRVTITASHPAILNHCSKSPHWRLTGHKPTGSTVQTYRGRRMRKNEQSNKLTA